MSHVLNRLGKDEISQLKKHLHRGDYDLIVKSYNEEQVKNGLDPIERQDINYVMAGRIDKLGIIDYIIKKTEENKAAWLEKVNRIKKLSEN